MAAERVALESREQVVQHLLTDPPAPARRQLEAFAIAGEVAGFLEPSGQVVQRREIACCVLAKEIPNLVTVDLGQVGRAVDIGERVLETIHRLDPGDLGERAIEAERFVAGEWHTLAKPTRDEKVEVRGKLGEIQEQPIVTKERLHHRLELRPLFRTHRAHERLQRGHPMGQLVDDVVESVRAGEEPPMLRQKLACIRVAAADPFAYQFVEVADHLTVGGEVFGAHRTDRVGHPGHELVQDLPLQALHDVIEPFAGVRLEEVVLLQTADALPDVGWQTVELIQPPRGCVPEHRPQLGILRGGPRRRLGIGGRLGCRRGGLVETTLHTRPLLRHDLVDLASDVTEHVAQPVAVKQFLSLAFQACEEVPKAGHVATGGVAAAPAAVDQPADRFREVALGHDVVGQRGEDLVRVEVGDVLAAVPARIPRVHGHRW